MSIHATITAVGALALSATDPMVILFDASATPALRQVAVIQQFENPAEQRGLHLQKGDRLRVGSATFTIDAVGQLANANLQSIGHVTLFFGPVPAGGGLANALYLSPKTRPALAVGTELTYQADVE
ncbi:PTS glucitol/sorbitol transporter subunit IIA [Lacticaseibacillus kribbianus]|uniref:PTS glucitol/sorbitol transporter subunit IIA n=1 Tax=Lacticaseibacillus kribbianus TaxID=2926292 RepID=UPI001CD6AAA0|nr:PTS glucitol/sorbitol transporter subunit IIA [Lacticaseibacillus kribbianus]